MLILHFALFVINYALFIIHKALLIFISLSNIQNLYTLCINHYPLSCIYCYFNLFIQWNIRLIFFPTSPLCFVFCLCFYIYFHLCPDRVLLCLHRATIPLIFQTQFPFPHLGLPTNVHCTSIDGESVYCTPGFIKLTMIFSGHSGTLAKGQQYFHCF